MVLIIVINATVVVLCFIYTLIMLWPPPTLPAYN